MASTVSWILRLNVVDGRLDTFKSLMNEMVSATQTNEPGTLAYEWFIDEAGKQCHLYERYADSAAALTHLGSFSTKFAERFMACVEPLGFDVYGDASPELRDALAPFSAGFYGTLGGFAR